MSDQIACDDILQVLRGNYIFFGLDDRELARVVEQVEVYQVDRGSVISAEGDRSQALYIVQQGKACQTKRSKGKDEYVKQMASGSSWGEECLQDKAKIRLRVTAITTLLVIRIDRSILLELADQIPQLAANLHISGGSNQLQQRTDLPWLYDGEEVFFIGRKHPVFLIKKILLPIAVAFITFLIVAMIVGGGNGDYGAVWGVAAIVFLGCACWAAWNVLDWSNDYSIVTSLRVVWMERTLALYDTRHEAPLSMLQTVDVQTTQLGRIFGYGNVVVRTITGPLVLPDVEYPEEVASMIHQHWEAARVNQRQNEISNIEQTLRVRLNQGQTGANRTGTQTPANTPPQVEPGFLQELFADFFKVRIEANGVVTYRKHWFVFFSNVWKPILISLLTLGVWILRLADVYTFISPAGMLGFCSLIWLGMIGWMVYEYIDWRNDVYQITSEQIIDMERKPLGKEEKMIAQLENILSIEYKRLGIAGILLNYGTVSIMVGTNCFTFDQVYDPSRVQQDLFRRMAERQRRQKHEEIISERERVSDWIATYHEHQDEYRTTSQQARLTPQTDKIG